MFKQMNIYDLDGVLVDSSHRYRNLSDGSIDLDYWIKNRTPDKIALDKILPHSSHYQFACIDPYTFVIVCTARQWTAHDQKFIYDRLGEPNVLIMRPVGNMQNDAVLKRRQLQRLFNLRQFQNLPRYLWEDNPKNIDALRSMFTKCFYIPSQQGA